MIVHDCDDSVISELEDLLDQERMALLDGDLDRVARLTENKESIVDKVNQITAADTRALEKVQQKMQRNQVLLTGAMEGIRTVADKMSALKQVRRGLDTYDRFGKRKKVITRQTPTVERRA